MSTSQTWIEDGVEIELYTFAHVNVFKTWRVDGKYYRTDGPATCEWDSDGTKTAEWWMVHGKYHRRGGPATCEWDSDGTKIAESWMVDGKYHRTDGPSWCEWDSDGTLRVTSWSVDNKFHRTDGPAVNAWNGDGDVILEQWYMDGKACTEEEVRRTVARRSMQDKVLRASRLLSLGQQVPKLSDDILSAVGRFLD